MILDDIESMDARGRTTRKRSNFASIFRYASAIVRQFEIYDGMSSIVTGRRMETGEIRGVQRGDAASRRRCVSDTHRRVVQPFSWRAAKIKKMKKKEHVGESAAICQYGNKARCSLSLSFSLSLLFSPACLYLSLSLYLVRCRYKQAHNVGAKMPTDGIPVPLPRRPHALTHPESLMKPPTMLAFIGFHRFSSVSRSA